jgi:hypothetical protein
MKTKTPKPKQKYITRVSHFEGYKIVAHFPILSPEEQLRRSLHLIRVLHEILKKEKK